jgi:hypothetical protein
MFSRTRARRWAFALVAATGALATACGAGSGDMSTMDHGSAASSSTPGHDGTSGMNDMPEMPAGDGLAAESAGFRFAPAATSLNAGATSFTFRITDGGGKAVTAFEPDQTKLMHFYLVRADLTGFQHVHPTMAADGTWTAPLTGLDPGSYRGYASFTSKDASGKAVPLVLSQQVTVPGDAPTTPLPAPSATTQVDGYTLTLAADQLMAGMRHELTVTVSRDGQPVTDLQPYLETYAHLTAFHQGDLAFAHLHPHGTASGDHGGPTLTFEAMLPKAGQWRLFVQFQTNGVLHTAPVTITVG